MKRMIVYAVTLLMVITLLTACGGDPLVGTWSATIGGDAGEMVLNADGTGTILSNGVTRTCKWTIEEDTLTVVQYVDGYPYIFLDEVTYSIQWRTLTVTNPDTGNTLEFKKK